MTRVRQIDCSSLHLGEYDLPRSEFDVAQAMAIVTPVCEAVRLEGEQALRRFSAQFDHVVPEHFALDPAVLKRCFDQLDPALEAAYRTSIERRRAVATQEAAIPASRVDFAAGAHVFIRTIPVHRVGLYVPGGVAPLASSVIMNVVPAQVAGVASLALATPPGPDGLPHPTILALCHMLEVEEVYAVGGAQAIAMLAYGVEGLCPAVDMITGPGNIYVVAAKRLVKGLVGIDSEAGPSEIAILADETASPRFVAADLMSQAEHDPLAASVLVTDSPTLVEQVEAELTAMVAHTAHRERVEQALAGPQSATVLVRDLDQGLELINCYGAEHLEIQTKDAAAMAARVRNAGAIFVGAYSPVSLGDYSAGSTHVLPTSGAARHSSGLTVRSFLKTVHVIDYDQQSLSDIASGIEAFALSEDLPAHANAISVRSGS